MKRSSFTLLFSLILMGLFAQESAKKYILIEHFTNSVCSICASRNPAMFNTLTNYEGDYHHVAYHPPAPYSSCIFYQHNTIENAARANYYNILGTPSVALSGTLLSGGNPLLPVSKLEEQLNLTSPIQVLVEETDGQDRQVTVKVKTVGDAPAQDLRLYVAVVEKEVYYNAPNGEDLHHNVFRDMLTDIEGDTINAAASGQELSFNFNYSIHNSWVESQIYVLAFVQDPATKEVLNSGTRFDENTLSLRPALLTTPLKVFPNPAVDLLRLDLRDIDRTDALLEVYNSAGSRVISSRINDPVTELGVQALPSGLYLLKVRTAEGVMSGRFVKE